LFTQNILNTTKMPCIYRIRNKNNGKSYIGQTKYDSPKLRFSRHIADMKRRLKNNVSLTPFEYALSKHGEESFEVMCLCVCGKESLDSLEQYYAEIFESYIWDFPGGYNATECGKGRPHNFNHKEEHKEKLSKLYTGRKLGEETREKISKAHTGKTINWSPETRARVSELSRKKATGVIFTEERKRKIGEKSKGRQATLGQTRTPEQRRNIGNASKGRKFSENTKKQMSEIHKKRHQENPIPHKNCKYTIEDILNMRNNPENLTEKELCNKYNIFPNRLKKIINREVYKYVKDN